MAESEDAQTSLQTADSNGASEQDDSVRLKELVAQATLKYSVKDYDAAAELYAFATELQAEINGEMSPENADLLYAYGRCLYHVAVKNSDVLGSKVAGETREEEKKSTAKKDPQSKPKTVEQDKDRSASATKEKATEPPTDDPKSETENKPYFQFTGDENFDTSEDDEEDGEKEEADPDKDPDEEDDFVVAYEVLDLARVLLQKKIEEVGDSQGKGKEKEEPQETRQLKERLSDTYDLQAEISLEGERFPSAVIDLKASLDLKKALYPEESSLIAEAHFKLSLALEFSSVTQQKDENGEVKPGTVAQVDEAMREEAAQELEAAISSCKLRISKEESRLESSSNTPSAQENSETSEQTPNKSKPTKADIDDVKEMVKELQQRLLELRQPPVSINDPLSATTLDGSNPLSGILGSILGDSPAVQKAKLEEAAKGANDLTKLVKRKKPAAGESPAAASPAGAGAGAAGAEEPTSEVGVSRGNGKRKADDIDGEEETGQNGVEKKVKIDAE